MKIVKRLDLNNKLINVASNPSPPLFYGDYNLSSREWIPKYGLDVTFLNVMGEYYNFRWRIEHAGYKWGQSMPNGSWDGLIGKIANKKADIGLGAVSISFEKLKVVDFTIPNAFSRLTFATLQPHRQPISGVLLMPFQTSTWLALLTTLIVLLVFSKLMQKVYNTKLDVWWLAFSGFMLKDSRQKWPNSMAIHIFLEICWYSGLIILSAYAGNLISFLTVNNKLSYIETIQQLTDLAFRNQVIPMMVNNSEHMQTFQANRKNAAFNIIIEKLSAVETYRKGFEKLVAKDNFERNNYVLIGPYYILDAWARIYGRQYFHISDTHESAFYNDFFGVALHKNSVLKQHFDKFIRLASEGHLFNFWYHNSLRKTSKLYNLTNALTYENDNYASSALRLDHVDDQFFLFLYAITASILILTIEIALNYSCESNI